MSENKVPCFHCEERSPDCHGRCEQYIAFKRKKAAEKAAHRKRSAQETDYLHVRRFYR